MAKASALQVAFFDKPPYYEHEVLANLEELSLANSKGAKELNRNFQAISKSIDNSSEKIVSSIQDEMTQARIQSAIENERLARGIAETNYQLLEVASGIDELSDVVRYGNESIVEAINQSSEQIVNGLLNLDRSLSQIDYRIQMVNSSLNIISNQLQTLIEKISKPNETEALELADQARINLSLNKKERALKVTKNALELSNGTSIIVLAYHILTLSLFDDEESKKELAEAYDDYVNLVSFKLTDKQSDETTVLQEVDSTLYPVMATVGYNLSDNIMLLTQKLYTALYENRAKTDNTLKKPLFSSVALEMITHPNRLRELHWSLLLNEYVIKKQSLKDYIAYIVALAKSKVLIKNELMILAVKNFYQEGLLYSAVIDALAGNNDENLNNVLKVILSLLPQDVIDIDYKTYWALRSFAQEYNIKVNELLEEKFANAKDGISKYAKENYINYFNNLQQKMSGFEEEIVPKIETIKKEHKEISNKYMAEWEKHNKKIEKKGYSEKLKNVKYRLNGFYKPEYNNKVFQEIGIALGLIIAFISSFFTSGVNNIGIMQFLWLILVYSVAGWFIGKIVGWLIDKIRETIKSILWKKISYYEMQLAKKYNIKSLKEELDEPYNQKTDNLLNQLNNFREKCINDLEVKLSLLIYSYIPLQTEQLATPLETIKESIEYKMLDNFIANKRPNDLKYQYNTTQSSKTNKTTLNKYEKIDTEKLAIEYIAKYKTAHNNQEPTEDKLIEWLEKEFAQNDSKVQYLLGTIYESVYKGSNLKSDKEKASSWYEKACNNGIASACYNLALDNFEGQGVEQNYQKALELFTKACDMGHVSACRNLAIMYAFGKGANKNYNKAASLYKKLCNTDDAHGCYALATMYEAGIGVEQDIGKALWLYKKACDNGFTDACEKYNRLSN